MHPNTHQKSLPITNRLECDEQDETEELLNQRSEEEISIFLFELKSTTQQQPTNQQKKKKNRTHQNGSTENVAM